MNMFEKASKQKLRFESNRGMLTVEDLWDLPLKHRSGLDLDTLAKGLNRQIKEQEEESFVVKASSTSTTLKTKFDIVKHIIDVRLAEKEKAEEAAAKKAKKDKIMEVIARKEDQSLENLSVEELKSMLDD